MEPTSFIREIKLNLITSQSENYDNLKIEDAECINTSFPDFVEKFNNAGGNIL